MWPYLQRRPLKGGAFAIQGVLSDNMMDLASLIEAAAQALSKLPAYDECKAQLMNI